jgi:hypothetical protein
VAALTSLVELWRRTVQPPGGYGFGKRSVSEGGVGLFTVSRAALLELALAWLRGSSGNAHDGGHG